MTRLLGTALVTLAVAACGAGPPRPHDVLDPGSRPLRGHFDADEGKVRAIFLASPT